MNLRRRIGATLIVLPVLITAAFAAGIWLVYLRLESQTLDRLLGRELDVLVQAQAQPGRVAEGSGLRYYRPAQGGQPAPPRELAALPPGSYRDFSLDQGGFHVLVRDVAPGDRAYLTYDVDVFESRERYLGLALAAGLLLTGLLAWLSSGWLAARALRPLDQLLARIRGLDFEANGQRLAGDAQDGELTPIIDAFNERLREIDTLVARERAFASAASHELRTPLAVIRGAAEVLAAQHGASIVLSRIERAVHEAVQDLDALLALSRSRALPEARDLSLDQLLPQLAEPYAEQARACGTRLVWQLAPCSIRAPAGAVAIIFTNLLRNALAAAPQGEVRVELDGVRLAVTDDGPGIAAEDLPRMFQPGTSRSGGSGMGLYIARTLADRCGFKLDLRPAQGRGVCAELILR